MEVSAKCTALAVLLFVGLTTICSCMAPHRDYSVEQIQKLDDLEELMDVQATVADPRFVLARKLAGRDFSAADWAAFADMGTRLQATTAKVAEFSEGEDFDRWNAKLGDQARALVGHVEAKAGPETLATVKAMLETCRACHNEYK